MRVTTIINLRLRIERNLRSNQACHKDGTLHKDEIMVVTRRVITQIMVTPQFFDEGDVVVVEINQLRKSVIVYLRDGRK